MGAYLAVRSLNLETHSTLEVWKGRDKCSWTTNKFTSFQSEAPEYSSVVIGRRIYI
jgi:hypothetical protein